MKNADFYFMSRSQSNENMNNNCQQFSVIFIDMISGNELGDLKDIIENLVNYQLK